MDEEIQKLIKHSYGEPPDHLGTFFGIEINKTLTKETLYALVWWLENDMELTRKRHKEHMDFLNII